MGDQQSPAISIHALREEGDSGLFSFSSGTNSNFYPRPPRGGRQPRTGWILRHRGDFYPRPPRGGRPGIVGLHCVAKNISIHALREEGDFSVHLPVRCHPISIHALREEGDVAGVVSLWVVHRFLSTPSARRATCCPRCCLHPFGISIHALREEGDGKHRSGVVLGGFISIHALREEGDISSTPSVPR